MAGSAVIGVAHPDEAHVTDKTWLVVNGASGSNSEASVASLSEALAQVGRRPDRVLDLQHDGPPAPGDLDGAGVGLLVVFGGDGSLNAVICALEGWDGAILALPGGTANLLAKSLHGDAAAEEIIARLDRLAPQRHHAIRCGAGTGLIEVLAGPGATWSDVREGLREGDIGQVAGTAIDAAVQSAAGPMVHAVDPKIGRDEGYSGLRFTPAGDGMAVSGYGAQRLADYVLQGIALLRRDFREGPHDELGHHVRVVCRSIDGSPIELMIDGERATGGAEETFSLAPLAVNLLAGDHG